MYCNKQCYASLHDDNQRQQHRRYFPFPGFSNIFLYYLNLNLFNYKTAAELDLESSTSSVSSVSGVDTSDQEMDLEVSENIAGEIPFFSLPESDSQALVPIMPTRPSLSLDTNAVSVYRSVNRISSHSNFRVVPALSPAGQAARVVASTSTAQLPSSAAFRAITAGNEIAKFSIEPNSTNCYGAPKSGDANVASIQYDPVGESNTTPERICIRESVISLLLRLHSRFNGNNDTYKIPSDNDHMSVGNTLDDGRVGDGAFWVGKVLDKLCLLDRRVRQTIVTTKEALWPQTRTNDARDETTDQVQEKEKKRKIKERQQRLLQEFANKQKQFLQQAMAAEDMDTADPEMSTADPASFTSSTISSHEVPNSISSSSSAKLGSTYSSESLSTSFTANKIARDIREETPQDEYDCVICNQASPSTSDRPMCLVVLLQASSVLSHKRCHPFSDLGLALPVCEEDRSTLSTVGTMKAVMQRRIDHFRQHFDEVSLLSSFNIGFEGGVYVHTCGHYLHLDCHKQYLQSLRSQQRQQSLNVERGEYSCPLCRQLANSILPIATQLYSSSHMQKFAETQAVPSSRSLVLDVQNRASDEILNMFNAEPPINLHVGSNLMEAMGRVMEDITNTTYPRFRQITQTPSPASLSQFVQSIARTNLEIELLQRGDSIIQGAHIRGCGLSSSSMAAPSSCSTNLSHLINSGNGAVGSGSGSIVTGSSQAISSAWPGTRDSSPTPGTSSANWNSPGLELQFSSSPTPGASSKSSSTGVAGRLEGSKTHPVSPWSLLPKRSCMLPLLHVLATHSKILTTQPYQKLWSQIAGLGWVNSPSTDYATESLGLHASVGNHDMQVPLLLQDVSCLLIQMVLILPLPLDRSHFSCLVQRLFNVVLVQIAIQLSIRFNETERKLYKALNLSKLDWKSAALVARVVQYLDDSPLYTPEQENSVNPVEISKGPGFNLEMYFYSMALDFLRLTSLLQFHLFGDPLPSSSMNCTDHDEFVELCSYLSITQEPKFDPWIEPGATIGRWCHEFLLFFVKSQTTAKVLLDQHKPWRSPRLLVLPHSYDTLFQVKTHLTVALKFLW